MDAGLGPRTRADGDDRLVASAVTPAFSIVIPTFRRGESLAECLESIIALDFPKEQIEVIIIDNGGAAEHTQVHSEPFKNRLTLRHLINRVNRGYGFSVNRGIVESRGDCILLLNDDARPMADLLSKCAQLLASDPSIGCVGCRAIETGYIRTGSDIGTITEAGKVIGNFDIDCGSPIDVEHVYGFCYFFTREAVQRAGLNDRTLLAQPYSSGNRIETDHCLTISARGLRVVYHPGLVAVHLAKPRPDMSERSPRWHRNEIRNTLYLFLKHFGPFGKGGAALRLTFLDDVGILSAVRHPTAANWAYFFHGLGSRTSAYWHWMKYLAGPRADTPAAFQHFLAKDA
jgi:GT2 family glycosyltransferase